MTGHFITPEWELKSVVLETKKVEGSHTAENIASSLRETQQAWSFVTPTAVTDNANQVLWLPQGQLDVKVNFEPWMHFQMQRMSSIYQQHREGVLHKSSTYQKAFACAYFLMKETLPNVKFMPLITFIEKACKVTQLSHFNHTSPASHREMCLELGDAVKDRVLDNVPKEGPIGLLTDEATDIFETSQLISFVQFFNKALGKTDTAFLGIQDVLEEHDAPDAKTTASQRNWNTCFKRMA